jgi:hypothetical protein
MDAAGAEELRKRIEEQRHWRRAAAVRDGRQPATDPDQFELEEIGEDVRYYGREQQRTAVAGRPVLVTFRMTKTLVDGSWETSLARESVRYLDGGSGPGTQQVSADSGL